MKKSFSLVAIGVVLISGLIFAMIQLNNQGTEKASENIKSSIEYKGPKLHWFHEDKYPTAEQLTRFHTHKGQFPLETAELVKQN